MKILVPIKRVIDPYVKIRVKNDGTGVETTNVKMAMNPFDEIAVEEALTMRESSLAEEVIAVSIGDDRVQETIRTALAMGADRGIFLKTELNLQPLAIAKLLKTIVEREQPQLIIMGKQSIDGDNNQTGQMLAALLAWGQATFASKVELDNEQVTVTREIDGGLEVVAVKLPAVITTDLRLNTPRYATLPNIMKAKRKPMDIVEVAGLGVDIEPRLKYQQIASPPPRQPGIKINSVVELVDKLKNEAGVI